MVLEPPEIAYIWDMLLAAFSGVRCPLLSADLGGVFELTVKDENEGMVRQWMTLEPSNLMHFVS